MAKYTELFSEYLEDGGELPAVFDTIPGFKELFIGEFLDREIGFETPTLFTVKLETRAKLIIPAYAARIQELEEVLNNLNNPTKKRVKTGSITRNYGADNYTDTRTLNNGARTQTTKDTPFTNIGTDGISQIVENKGFEDKDTFKHEATDHEDTETYNSVTDEESGYTPSEAEALFTALENEVFIIKRELLKEFNTLFMVVY